MCHVIASVNPPIAVRVVEDLACDSGEVGAAAVPKTGPEDDRRARGYVHFADAFFGNMVRAVREQPVVELMAARHNAKRTAIWRSEVSDVVTNPHFHEG